MSGERRTRVVSFDLDETLWDFLPMMDGALRSTIDELERRRPDLAGRPITVEELHQVRAEVAQELEGSYEELRRESFRRVLMARGCDVPALRDWMVEHWMSARVDTVALHDDVEPAMDELSRRGYVVGAITNGNFPLHRHTLAERLAFIVHAEHVGEFKPAAGPFRVALELAGAEPHLWVHVGDSLETDVAGAQAFGLRAVWLNRAGLDAPDGYAPDAELRSLDGLADLVDRLLLGA